MSYFSFPTPDFRNTNNQTRFPQLQIEFAMNYQRPGIGPSAEANRKLEQS
ncbi:MAG: hypothetical protein WBP93_01310 [Pyrinomonadaceae bacterium]